MWEFFLSFFLSLFRVRDVYLPARRTLLNASRSRLNTAVARSRTRCMELTCFNRRQQFIRKNVFTTPRAFDAIDLTALGVTRRRLDERATAATATSRVLIDASKSAHRAATTRLATSRLKRRRQNKNNNAKKYHKKIYNLSYPTILFIIVFRI